MRRKSVAASPLLGAALEYFQRGFSVFPTKANKRPMVKAIQPFFQSRPSEDEVQLWFGERKPVGIAIVMGAVSGNLICRDFDDERGYWAWWGRHAELAAKLPTVKTSRGFHVYGRVADLDEARPRAGQHIRKIEAGSDKGEWKIDHTYAVAPPSRHESGATYAWHVPLPPLGTPIPLVRACDLWDFGTENRETEESEESQESDESERQKTFLPRCLGSENSISIVLELPAETSDPANLELIDDAIAATAPTETGTRHARLFDFARRLKAMPILKGVAGIALEPIVRRWHNQAAGASGTSWGETWFDFLDGWDKVRFAKGDSPLQAAIDQSAFAPIPACVTDLGPQVVKLTSVCWALQTQCGEQPFFLSSRTAAKLIESQPSAAWKMLNGLCKLQVLKCVDKGTSGAHGKAARFRYIATNET